jgi:hypothetical protein
VVATTVTFVLLASLLNARGIMRTAETQPTSARGDASRAVGAFLQNVSGRAHLDRPRRAIDSALHPDTKDSGPKLPAGYVAPPRTGTVADPLRVLLVGDSLMDNVSAGVRRRVAGKTTVRLEVDAIPGTAINWPFRFDWPKELRHKVRSYRPEVVGFMFGGHDWRKRKLDGKVLAPPDEAWRKDYAKRVDELVRIASSRGARVYWLGLPDVEPAEMQRAVPEMDAVFESMEPRWPGFTYIDTHAAVAGPNGGFARYLRAKDGTLVLARQPDGLHFEPYGQDLIAGLLVTAMGRDWPDLAP